MDVNRVSKRKKKKSQIALKKSFLKIPAILKA